MSNQDLVQHVYGHTAKFGWVQKRIAEHCSFVWVEFGKTFRDATFQEAAQMRKAQAQQEKGLVYFVEGKDGKLLTRCYFAEIPNFHVKWPTIAQQTLARQGYALIKQANSFAINCLSENAA